MDSAKLKRGMKVPSFNGEQLTVVNVQALGRSGKTFNLTVADFHTFFAGEASAYVHNQCPCALAAKGEAAFFRGAKAGEAPSFVPRPNDFKVDAKTGFVKDTHGVSVFDNPLSVSSNGYVPHRVDQSSIPDSLRIIQRGSDPRHFEIVPRPGANLTPQQFINACNSIVCVR